MSDYRIPFVTISVLVFSCLASPPATSEDLLPHFGTTLSETEIRKYSITVFPDGTNLPSGHGNVSQGASLYNKQCMMCHGKKGIEGPAARLAGKDGWFSISDPTRVLRINKYPILLISVGGLWPYATTIFDYIRRAMPHYAPKSLTNDEVYALTAYILYLNDLVDDEAVLDESSILDITMPGKERGFSAWDEMMPENCRDQSGKVVTC